jgi:hypothetical protein
MPPPPPPPQQQLDSMACPSKMSVAAVPSKDSSKKSSKKSASRKASKKGTKYSQAPTLAPRLTAQESKVNVVLKRLRKQNPAVPYRRLCQIARGPLDPTTTNEPKQLTSLKLSPANPTNDPDATLLRLPRHTKLHWFHEKVWRFIDESAEVVGFSASAFVQDLQPRFDWFEDLTVETAQEWIDEEEDEEGGWKEGVTRRFEREMAWCDPKDVKAVRGY